MKRTPSSAYHVYVVDEDVNQVGTSADANNNNNNNNLSLPAVITTPRRPPHHQYHPVQNPYDLAEFAKSLLSRAEYMQKCGNMNDNLKERQECPLLVDIVDKELGVDETLQKLQTIDPDDVLRFLKTQKGARYIRELMQASDVFHANISRLIVKEHMVAELSLNPSGNFLVQEIPGHDSFVDERLCEQLQVFDVTGKQTVMSKLTVNKYGCRVVQAFIKKFKPKLVKKLVDALKGYESEACLSKNGTHVVQCLLTTHKHHVYEGLFRIFTKEPRNLCQIIEDQFGCRIMQKCLDSLAHEITHEYVPPILNALIIPILQDAKRFAMHDYANYVIQYIIESPAFRRQRDYIIDVVILGNMLELSQHKFASHVVEAALGSACSIRLTRMCHEIFHDYKTDEKGKTPLEILLFDQYGNYVVQRLLQIAIDVVNDKRVGDKSWLSLMSGTIVRNQQRLKRYSSGKKILSTMMQVLPNVYSGIVSGMR